MGTIAAKHPDLTSLRRQKGLSLDWIAETTKIAIRYLKAIEQGQFSKLPGGLYNISYLRQYAQAVQCDEATLLDYYYVSTCCVPEETVSNPSRAPLPAPLVILRNVSIFLLRKI